MSIVGNMVGGSAPLKTVILTDESGNEIATGVVTDSEVVFTATDNDVREGMVYASDSGISTGSKNIPAYRTERGHCMIFDGDQFSISSMSEYDQYDYTELQCIIALFNTSVEDSVVSDKVVLNNNVYPTNSSVLISTVSKDSDKKSIDFNIVNDSGSDYIIHYFTYRKED